MRHNAAQVVLLICLCIRCTQHAGLEVDKEGTYAAITLYTAQVYPVHKPGLGWLRMHTGESASTDSVDCLCLSFL